MVAILLANFLGWPVLQLSIAYLSEHLPERWFHSSRGASSLEVSEANFYRRVLRIRTWKHLLPDGALWVGGTFSKRRIVSHRRAYLMRFAREARRGELAHWCMLCCFPIFYVWNPPWARALMTVYAVVTNVPCIVVQRYNRFALLRRLARHPA